MKKCILISFALLITSCATKKEKSFYKPATTAFDLEFIKKDTIAYAPKTVINLVDSTNVSILHSLKNTGFHFYNSVAFANDSIGVIVGGAGMCIRKTTNRGNTWLDYQFSRFANPFYSVTFNNNYFFAVGNNQHIFRNQVRSNSWEVFDTSTLLPENNFNNIKFYKVKFLNNSIGFVVGSYNDEPIVLKTENSGDSWQVVTTKGISKSKVTDIAIINKNELYITTNVGYCYKTTDSGNNWQLIYKNDQQKPLNTVTFMNKDTGFLGGMFGSFLKTNDAGNTWQKIELKLYSSTTKTTPKATNRNIANIKFLTNNKLLITTTHQNTYLYGELESNCFLTDIKTYKTKPFLMTSNMNREAIGLQTLNNTVYILDRKKLYKTTINEKE